jgi:hypothetical protein
LAAAAPGTYGAAVACKPDDPAAALGSSGIESAGVGSHEQDHCTPRRRRAGRQQKVVTEQPAAEPAGFLGHWKPQTKCNKSNVSFCTCVAL